MTLPKIDFTYKHVQDGQTTGIFSSKGTLTPLEMTLNGLVLPMSDIFEGSRREERLVIAFREGATVPAGFPGELVEGCFFILEITSGNTLEVEKFLNRICSHNQIEKSRQAYAEQGKSELFRTVACPHCRADINVSELPVTPLLFCRYCDSIFQENKGVLMPGTHYKQCPDCGMYDRVQAHTEFYFYFLLVIYGYSYKRRQFCDVCAASLFWSVFLYNFLFILGIFPALSMKYRSLFGRDERLALLPRANTLAREGNYNEADLLYTQLLARFPNHPGILYNKALGHFIGKDGDGGWECLDLLLKNCANYAPALNFIRSLQQEEAPAPNA